MALIDRFKRVRRGAGQLIGLPSDLINRTHAEGANYKHPKVLTGTMLAQLNNNRTDVSALRDVEFQVFSQFGDDGIIQYLIHHLGVLERTFIEFGVEDYTEASTRFLLVKDKWSGLVMDGDPENIDYISRDPISYIFDLRAKAAFINAENINALIGEAGFTGRIGLLSVDIDGMDYWVWKAIDQVDPAIVIVEYNAAFGPDRAIVVPYDPDFIRSKAHPSRLYWGASLAAYRQLAAAKGYAFAGCNANGNNAYFIRREYAELPAIKRLKPAFTAATFAEYAVDGHKIRGQQVYEVVKGLPVLNLATGEIEPL